MNQYRTDLIIEAEGMEAGLVGQVQKASEMQDKGTGVVVNEEWNKDHSMKVTVSFLVCKHRIHLRYVSFYVL